MDMSVFQRQSIGHIQTLLENIEGDVQKIIRELGDFNPLRKGLRWGAIFVGGIANLTYGGYYALTTILEAEGLWSLRLWMTTQEWWWFLLAILALALSLTLDVWAYVLGEDVDASILLLSFELGIGVNKVLIQAFRTHRFRRLMYECWSGRSRTARPRSQEWLRDVHDVIWRDCIARAPRKMLTMPTESRFNPHNWVPGRRKKLRQDVTEAMNVVAEVMHDQRRDRGPHDDAHVGESGYLQVYVYHTATDMSVAWGGNDSKLFQKRVSRGIMAVATTQIVDAFDLRVTDTDKWKVAADGILARNKGLQPWRLICKRTNVPDNPAETSSPLYPRASKTLRSRVHAAVSEQYHGLGESFVEAGTELNLLLRDANLSDVYQWLRLESEHQDLVVDWRIWRDAQNPKLNELLYLLHYVGMLLSLHFLPHLDCKRADEFVLLVAIKCMMEDDALQLGVSLADIQNLSADGQQSFARAKVQAAALRTAGMRIAAGYLGVWIDEDTAAIWVQWVAEQGDSWAALLSTT